MVAVEHCFFCGGVVAPSDPPEHVMPKWLRKFQPKGVRLKTQLGIIIHGDGPPTPPSYISSGPEIKTNVVCGACNGHWMSDLETRASQLLTPMIDGNGQPLSVEDQAFLAVWATKTVMMWQTAPSNRRAIPLAHYRWLHDRLTPPPLTKVRVGRFAAERELFIEYSQQNLFLPETPDPPPPGLNPHAWRGILTVGQLLLEVVGSGDDQSVPARFPNMTGPVLLDIWPGTGKGVYWPPPHAFGIEEMLKFLDATPADREHYPWAGPEPKAEQAERPKDQ
jgi:hypothetical protein